MFIYLQQVFGCSISELNKLLCIKVITVKVTVKNHSIVSIRIVDASKETASFFNRAKAVI